MTSVGVTLSNVDAVYLDLRDNAHAHTTKGGGSYIHHEGWVADNIRITDFLLV
jgi:hypothetical protein